MSIEVMGGGGGYPEYKVFSTSVSFSNQSTSFTTSSYDKSSYPEIILQISLSGYKMTGSFVQILFNYRFAFENYIDSVSINGTYGDSSFARATIKEVETTTSGIVKYSFNISDVKDSSGNTIYFYPSDSINYYGYNLYVYGYNPA